MNLYSQSYMSKLKLTGEGHEAAEEDPPHGESEELEQTFQTGPLYTSEGFHWANGSQRVLSGLAK